MKKQKISIEIAQADKAFNGAVKKAEMGAIERKKAAEKRKKEEEEREAERKRLEKER